MGNAISGKHKKKEENAQVYSDSKEETTSIIRADREL